MAKAKNRQKLTDISSKGLEIGQRTTNTQMKGQKSLEEVETEERKEWKGKKGVVDPIHVRTANDRERKERVRKRVQKD